jgi:uncharacterized protein YkwD
MKTILILPLFVLLLAACGTSVQAGAAATPNPPTATSASSELPTQSPTATDSPKIPPAATPSPTSVDAAAQPAPTALPMEDCINKAAFSEDVTIPDGTLVQMGETFTKTWRVHNAGTCNWSGYQLVYAGGEAMNGSQSNPMPKIEPDAYGNVSVDLTAPLRGGGFTGYWLFQNPAGKTFGVGAEGDGLLWVQINVAFPLPSGPTPVAAGATPVSSGASPETAGSTPVATATPVTTQGGCVYSQNPSYESQILGLINNVRAQNGLGALALNSQLSAAALEHSLDMACNDNISHTGTDGSTWYDRVRKQGFANYNAARENIYVGNPAFGGDANGAFTWWMNSEIHRKTLMNPDQKLIGISYIYSDASTYGGNYTTVFARP